jgi:sugar O-acyltransferase (sialic acid O-acetyltransferase NeuD family)
MSDREVSLIGAGGHAKVVLATLRDAGWTVSAAYDDDPTKWGSTLSGVPILGSVDQAASGPRRSVVAIGNNRARQKVAARLALEWVTAVHPRAWVDPSVRLGPGTVVFAGAVIQPDTVLGAHVIVNTGATIDHDGVLGDFVHVAPGCHLAGEVHVGDGAFLGTGSSVIVGVEVGPWSVVGAGGVVVRHVPPGVTAVGVPARPRGRES